MKEEKNRVFGLLGKNISYSFSRVYFTKKFKELNLKKNILIIEIFLATIQI
jgi:shikimate dehydrogenase